MGVRGQQANAAEAPRDQAAQEGKPGGAVLLGDDVQAERLAVAVLVGANGVHTADVDGPTALAALDHQRIEGEIRVGRRFERSGAEVLDELVQARR